MKKRVAPFLIVIAAVFLFGAPTVSCADGFNDAAASLYYQLRQEAVKRGVLITSGAEYDRIQTITKRLISVAGEMRPDASGWFWEVSYVQSPKINAMCLPGGKMFVLSGLLDGLSLSDDELAAVMGHEMGHALLEHGRETYEQRQAANVMVGILGVIAAIAGAKHHQDPNVAFGATTAVGTLGAEFLALRPYNRERELAADKYGAELSARAGFNPYGAISLQAKMSTRGTIEFLSTHPLSETRQNELAQVVPLMAQQFATRRNGQPAIAVASNSITPAAAAAPSNVTTLAQRTVSTQQTATTSLVASGSETAARPSEDPDAVTGAALSHMASKYMINAERYAKSNGCTLPTATMVARAPTYEAFEVKCSSGSYLRLRCENGECRHSP